MPRKSKSPKRPAVDKVRSAVLAESEPGQDNASLSADEHQRFTEDEATIKMHLQSFMEVGKALLRIRDQRLYRAEFSSFEAYCRGRWNMSRIHAHRLLSAAEITESVLLPMGNTPLPENERQVRPLVGLPVKEAQKAWGNAAKLANGKSPSGKLVIEAVHGVKALKHQQTRESWQDRTEPLLKEALKKTQEGDRSGLEQVLFKVQLQMEIGRSHFDLAAADSV